MNLSNVRSASTSGILSEDKVGRMIDAAIEQKVMPLIREILDRSDIHEASINVLKEGMLGRKSSISTPKPLDELILLRDENLTDDKLKELLESDNGRAFPTLLRVR